jgi:DNA-binding winged helix-turn-helix (wHTH) protein
MSTKRRGGTAMDGASVHQVVEFSGFRLDRRRRRVVGPDGAPVALKPRTFDTLVFFLDHPGEVLDKHAILDSVWSHVTVEENNLNQAISALRRALGETREEPRFIATVPGRGYQFIAPVRALSLAEASLPPVGARGALAARALVIVGVTTALVLARTLLPTPGAVAGPAAPAAASEQTSVHDGQCPQAVEALADVERGLGSVVAPAAQRS